MTQKTAKTAGDTSRRALLGIGGAAAVAVLAAQATSASAAPAAATGAASGGAAASGGSARPLSRRATAFRPLLAGGPSSVDESAALALRAAVTAEVPVGQQYTSFSKAAAAGALTRVPGIFDGASTQSHLLRRATFGQRPGDVTDLKKLGVDKWLALQFDRMKIKDPEGDAVWKAFSLAGASVPTILAKVDDYGWDAMMHTTYASLGKQIFSKRQIFEITVDIFANLLHVPIPGEQWATSPGYLSNVIRKNAFGKYSTMLKAAMKHPAMLNFLNNDESRKEHVNENLGRELLELHTVGIAGGYTEDDVKNSARILSGRSWEGWLEGRRKTYGQYKYNSRDHYVGPVQVLGFSHANSTASGGEAVADAYVNYLAHHPATAQKIARKIAVRFVTDTPSADLVNRLADVYLRYDTDIKQTVRAVFLSSDFWSATGTRMRRPLEDGVGTARVLDVKRGTKVKSALSNLFWSLEESGQTPHGWLPPNGYPDAAGAWLGGGAMIQRWNIHRGFMWWDFGFSRTVMQKIVTQTSTMTADDWLRKIVTRLLGVPMREEHLAAILAGADLEPTDIIKNQWWKSHRAVALVLDSPYFQLR